MCSKQCAADVLLLGPSGARETTPSLKTVRIRRAAGAWGGGGAGGAGNSGLFTCHPFEVVKPVRQQGRLSSLKGGPENPTPQIGKPGHLRILVDGRQAPETPTSLSDGMGLRIRLRSIIRHIYIYIDVYIYIYRCVKKKTQIIVRIPRSREGHVP